MGAHDGFMPIQPGFTLNALNYVEHKVRDRATRSATLYYQFQTGKQENGAYSVVPDGCVDILFCCDSSAPLATVHGSRLKKTVLQLEKQATYFGVRFIPNQKETGLNVSMKELINGDVPLADCSALKPGNLEKISCEPDFHKKIHLYNELGVHPVKTENASQRIVAYVINKIHLSKGRIALSRLAEETGYTERYVRRIFTEHVGMPPKLFCKITRYQCALHMLMQQCSIGDVMLQNGYYDQSQMINEFKKFSGVTPNQWVKALQLN